MKKYLFLFLLLSFIAPQNSFWAIVEVACSSRPHFSSTCTQCFIQDTNVYLWYGARNMTDTWFSGTAWEYIYIDENPNPVYIHPFYTDGELQMGAWGFDWSSNLLDGNSNNGEIYRDTAGDRFIRFLPRTSGMILQSQPSFFVKFANLSTAIENNGRNHPLWETQYRINYYNIWDWTPRIHTECVLNYPAWCWDGVFQPERWEQCDPGASPWQPWYNANCSNTCQTPPTGTTQCQSLTATPTTWVNTLTSNFTCTGINATTYRIDILNSAGNVINTINSSTGSYTFASVGNYSARCFVNTDISSPNCVVNLTVTNPPSSSWWSSSSSSSSSGWWSSSSWWGSTSSSWWGWGNYCGDGILQRPNSQWIMEECDFWSNYSTWPAWCSLPTATPACKILENTLPWGLTDRDNTLPWGGTIALSPGRTLLLWGWMWIFEYLASNNASIQNNSTSDIYIDKKLCVYKQWFLYQSMSGNSVCSNTNIWHLARNGGIKNLVIADDRFVANISNMPENVTQTDGQIITTLEGLQNTQSFLKSILNIRVAKPTVNTIGGGASLLDGTKLSDVSQLSRDMWPLNPNLNKNLILTSLWVNPLSSYTKSVSDSNFVQKSKDDGQADLSGFIQSFWSGNTETLHRLPTQKYNGFDNIFTHIWNVNLSSQSISWGNKTYIIENGNLYINGNITSDDNILLVIKNGNIIIKSTVTQIDAIIINIWWKIQSDVASTTRLVINGALYGDVADLLAKRTYIKDRGEYVDVGTNVNFTSKVFSSPPPLLSKFLWEYMEGNKIPK